MREQEYIEAMEQLRLSDSAKQKIIDACQERAPKPAPRRKSLRWTIGVAVLTLIIVGGTLLPRLFPAENSFTITAYAADTKQAVSLNDKAVEFSFQSGITDTGINMNGGYMAGYISLGGGQIREPIRFHCEGKGIESITYTAEGCYFSERLVLTDWDKYYDQYGGNMRNLYIEEKIIEVSWPFDADGQPWPQGQALRDLGQSYTVTYEAQHDADYQIRYPINGVQEEDYDGTSPILMTNESPLPSGILHATSYVPPTVTWYYTAEEASITVTVNFTDGRTESKVLRLALKSSSAGWYTISIEAVEQ